eukprot:6492217-Amphidinium_carterae.1
MIIAAAYLLRSCTDSPWKAVNSNNPASHTGKSKYLRQQQTVADSTNPGYATSRGTKDNLMSEVVHTLRLHATGHKMYCSETACADTTRCRSPITVDIAQDAPSINVKSKTCLESTIDGKALCAWSTWRTAQVNGRSARPSSKSLGMTMHGTAATKA